MQLGEQDITKEVIIADIKDDVLVGMDIGNEVDILTSQNKLIIDGMEVKCNHIRQNRDLRVTAADTYRITGETECEIAVYVSDDQMMEDERLGEILIEPSANFCEKYRVVIGRSLIDLTGNITGRMRVMNPFKEELTIRQGAVVGYAEEMDDLEFIGSMPTDEEDCQREIGHRREKLVFKDEHRDNSSVGDHVVPTLCTEMEVGINGHEDGSSCLSMLKDGQEEQSDGHLSSGTTHDYGSLMVRDHWHNNETLMNRNEEVPLLSQETVRMAGGHEEASRREGYEEELDIPDHLTEMYKKATEGKSAEDKRIIQKVLHDYRDVFSKDDTDLGRTNLSYHVIDTGDSRPIKQPPRRVPSALSHEEEEAINQLHRQGVIRESNSPWASPIVLVRRKNGKIRACIDYRKVNLATRKDAYPIPRTQDCLDAMAGSVIFSTLDMTSGYYQVPIHEPDIPKTAFATRHGLWEFVTMPFGLTNAPATFQRLMELAMRGLQWTSCLIYLDDIIIFGRTFQEHAERLKQVLGRIRQANLKLKPEKCELFQDQVRFLGHIVSSEGVQPDPSNTAKVTNWAPPKTVTEVRQFLGLCSYYRRFVKNFSIIANPLSKLTTKDSELVWTSECQNAFEQLKAKLTGADVMSFPRDEGTYILDTDACDVGIGGVLSQVQGDRERVVAYGSRSLNKSERNYCVTDKELLAVRYFVDYFRYYLLGRQFLLRTDHQAIKWLFSLKEPKGRIQRWIEILSAYDFQIEYRPGAKHGNADGLSRCPNPQDCVCPDLDNEEVLKCGPCNKCLKRSSPNVVIRAVHESHIININDQPHMEPEIMPDQENTQTYSYRPWSILIIFFTLCTNTIKSIVQNLCRATVLSEVMTHHMQQGLARCKTLSKYLSGGFPIRRQRKTHREDDKPLQAYSQQELKRLQENDKAIGPIIKWKHEGRRPVGKEMASLSPEIRHYWNYWNSLELHEDILYKRNFEEIDNSNLQLIVPQELRKHLIDRMHNSVFGGHLGVRKTISKLLRENYWFNMRDDVKVWVKLCDTCAANSQPSPKPKATLGDMRTGAPFDRLGIDILGPLPLSNKGNRYIQVATDAFTKWVEIMAIPDQTAETCASHLVDEIISRYGCPLDLHSDQGRNYDSRVFKELCRLLEIRKTRTTPRRPQCNGQTERFNRTIIKMIKAYIKDDQREWDTHLSCLAGAYRAACHDTTGFSPNFLMFGREVRLPGEVSILTHQSSYPAEYVSKVRDKLTKAYELVRVHIKTNTERQKDRYDTKSNLHIYKPGDLVWYLNEIPQPDLSPKLQDRYSGPFVVLWKYNQLDYLIQKDKKGRRAVVHHDKLKPYEGKIRLSWAKSAVGNETKKHQTHPNISPGHHSQTKQRLHTQMGNIQL